MQAKSVVGGFVVAAALVIAGATSVSANVAWCMFDPPVAVQTPAGTTLVVDVTVTLPASQARYAPDFVEHAYAIPDRKGGTGIFVAVELPDGVTFAKITATVEGYSDISATRNSKGGRTVILYLDVPAA